MTTPRATMRIQFHAGFTFADMEPNLDYLRDLGVSHLYASPILTARAGSMHCYDVVDPTTVNPELGGEDGLRVLSKALRARGLGLILDIVPNHMAVGGDDNRWWLDLLANGEKSRFATFFDIDWQSPHSGLRGKILAPFLGRPYGDALAAGEIRLGVSPGSSAVAARYFDHLFPIRPEDQAAIREKGLGAYDPDGAEGRDNLHALLERQHYRLAWWRAANDMINWRRFFDVNGLASLRVEDEHVFEATHGTLLRLYRDGVVDGLRVDHIDGLADPAAYCRRLRRRLSELEPLRPSISEKGPAFLIVEKILAAGESLPANWRTDGTSGYDFMNEVSLALHAPAGEQPLTETWRRISGVGSAFSEIEREARRELLERSFGAQFDAACCSISELLLTELSLRDWSIHAVRRVLREIVLEFHLYRTYEGARDEALEEAIASAEPRVHLADLPLLPVLAEILRDTDKESRSARRPALVKFRQLTAPLAAKAVEDTAFYRYGVLLSRMDVGFDPKRFATPDAFHIAAARRLEEYPKALLATATHDHKRGEDLRARLAVLSEAPELWTEFLTRTLAATDSLPGAPSPSDRVMLFQMMVGGWPLTRLDSAELDLFAERLKGWQVKALREAKLRSSWESPNKSYESTATNFIDSLFTTNNAVRPLLERLAIRIAPAGAVNSLSQCLLKLTSPGVPDFYQGCDLWDFSFVDPDNRRPVNWPARKESFPAEAPPSGYLPEWFSGAVKRSLIAAVLAERARTPEIFAAGAYEELVLEGKRVRHAIAFARTAGARVALTIAPREIFHMLKADAGLTYKDQAWEDTRLAIPSEAGEMRNICDGRRFTGLVRLDELLKNFPVACLVN